jgi:prevent-host-death family protein
MTVSTTELRDDLAAVVNRVAYGGERIVVRRHNQDVAALVSIDDLTLLRELENLLDLELIRQSRSEPGPDVPWDELRKRLGL